MTRPETTRLLSSLLEQHINIRDQRIYWAKEVTFDYATSNAVRVDYMQFRPKNNTVGGIEKGDFYCYEIKSSVEDFHSRNGHNFIGEYNYYVMPEDVYEEVKAEVPYRVGVYVPEEYYGRKRLVSKRKAIKQDRQKPMSEMLLMMFRSANRDNIKALKGIQI